MLQLILVHGQSRIHEAYSYMTQNLRTEQDKGKRLAYSSYSIHSKFVGSTIQRTFEHLFILTMVF